MRIQQGIHDVACFELRGHHAFELDDGIGVDHRPFTVADEVEVDRVASRELAGGMEDALASLGDCLIASPGVLLWATQLYGITAS